MCRGRKQDNRPARWKTANYLGVIMVSVTPPETVCDSCGLVIKTEKICIRCWRCVNCHVGEHGGLEMRKLNLSNSAKKELLKFLVEFYIKGRVIIGPLYNMGWNSAIDALVKELKK